MHIQGPPRPSRQKHWKRNSQGEDYTTKARAEDDLNRPIIFPCQLVQIAGECDARQQIGEEHKDGTRKDELIEEGPVGHVAATKVANILLKQPEGTQRAFW